MHIANRNMFINKHMILYLISVVLDNIVVT